MKKSNYTTIKCFEIVKPKHNNEHKGEILTLSFFGEYCPENSLRGYSLNFLLLNNKNYKPIKTIVKGIEYNLI